jgi:hypothetical protein
MSKVGKTNPAPLVSPKIASSGTLKPPNVTPHRP